ncbi:MAG: Uncharacterized protein CEN87_306 [Parcubacteria group bacterium Licking1014_1]|nr:MAG: Uncharacterized protein CEN87_306 [Parcubacteria group bacterium Licking1014_1]
MNIKNFESMPQIEEETNERFGRNVEIRATFMRHATKADASDITGKSLLSKKGQEESREKGKKLETKEHGIKAYMSPVARAIETADLILEEQEKKGTKVFKSRKKAELVLWPGSKNLYNEFAKITKENLPADYDNLREDEKQEVYEKAEDFAVDWLLYPGEKKFDTESASPYEIAVGISKLVDRYIKMSDRLYSGSSVDLLNVSHKGTFEAFLKEVLLRKNEQGEVVRGFDKIEEIGGALKPAESWELDIRTDETGKKTIKLHFRGGEFDLDLQKLEELLSSKK